MPARALTVPGRGAFEVATPAGPIHARVDGRGDAPWLVFSNSHGTDLSLWDRQVEALADRFRILRYDQRGHGATPPVDGPCRFDGLATDLLAVMDAAGAGRAVLVGISMGAVTVLRAAALRPERVAAVVAADGQWRSPPTGRAAWQERIDRVLAEGTGSIAEATAERWFLPGLRTRDPATFESVRAMVAATSRQGYVGCAQALQDYDFTADYPGLAMPVLYLVGARDGTLPDAMRAMAAATPRGRFVAVPDAGHLPNLERPQDFLRALDGFLAETGADRGLV